MLNSQPTLFFFTVIFLIGAQAGVIPEKDNGVVQAEHYDNLPFLSTFSKIGKLRGGITLTIKYSKLFTELGTNETTTSWLTGWQIETGKPDALYFKVGLKHNSTADDAMFQLKLYSKVTGKTGDIGLPVSGNINVLNDHRDSFTVPFKRVFSTKDPDTRFFNLLTHDVLINPDNGYYNQKLDQIKISIPLYF